MKGQSQVVSVIILIVLVMGAIALVLPWTFTMIQKRKDMKSMDDIYNFFKSLDETIINIANNGGEESLQLKVPGKFTVYPESSNSYLNNSIVFSFRGLVSFIAECDSSLDVDCWIPLNTPNTNITGTLGVDSPSIISGKTERKGDQLEVEYRILYRTLKDTPIHGYKIVLNTTDNKIMNTTVGFIKIQRIKSTSTQSLTTTEINIIV